MVGTSFFSCSNRSDYINCKKNNYNIKNPYGYGLMIGDKDAQKIGIGGFAYIYMLLSYLS